MKVIKLAGFWHGLMNTSIKLTYLCYRGTRRPFSDYIGRDEQIIFSLLSEHVQAN